MAFKISLDGERRVVTVVMTGIVAGRTRTALLHRPAARELAHFWETTFRNVGLQASAFEDEAAAYAWLAEKA